MRQYIQLLSRTVSYAFPDPIEAARPLLSSINERERKLGLRRLCASRSPEAQNLAIVAYRFASTLSERMRAEKCLVALSARSKEPTGDIALAILHTQSRSAEQFIPQKLLRRSAAHLTRILEANRTSADDLREIDRLLCSWDREATGLFSQSTPKLLNQLSDPWLTASEAQEFKETSPKSFARLNSRLQLTYMLQSVSSKEADLLRVRTLQGLEPGYYAEVVLRTIRPHLHQPTIRKATQRLLTNWVEEFGETSPDIQRLEGLLLTERWGITGPPQLFG